MKLKLVKYHPLYAYSVGDQFEVNEEHTKVLLEGKYATPVENDDKAEKLTLIFVAEAERLRIQEENEATATADKEKAEAEAVESKSNPSESQADQPQPDAEQATDKGAEASLSDARGKSKPGHKKHS